MTSLPTHCLEETCPLHFSFPHCPTSNPTVVFTFYFRMHHIAAKFHCYYSSQAISTLYPNHCNSLFPVYLHIHGFSLNYEQYMYSLPGLMCCMIWLLHILCHSFAYYMPDTLAFPQYLRHIKNFPVTALILVLLGNFPAFSMGPFFILPVSA